MNDDLFGERLGATLREHSPHPAPASLGLGDVQGCARGIRRRRTVAGSAAAAVAIMAAGPLAATTLAGDDEPFPPATSPTPTLPLPADLPATIRLDGEAPVVPGVDGEWFAGGALGGAVPVRKDTVTEVARIGTYWMLGALGEGGSRILTTVDLGTDDLDDVDPDVVFHDLTSWSLHDRVAVSDSGDLAAYSTADGDLVVTDEQARWRTVATLPSPGTPVDLVGSADCVDGLDCDVVVSYSDGRAPEVVHGDGARTVIDADAVAVDAADEALVATRGPARDDLSACTTVSDRASGAKVWASCEISVSGFSPDGSLALVTDSYRSGEGPPRVGVADARTGDVLTWLTTDDGGVVLDSQWTADGDLEVVSHASGTWRMHRLSLDGTLVQVAEPREGVLEVPGRPWLPLAQP